MMHNIHTLAPMIALLASLLACVGSTPPPAGVTLLPTADPSPAFPPATFETETPLPGAGLPSAAPASSEFNVAVIVDTTSEHVTREQAQAVIGEASSYLTPFSPYPLRMVDFVEDGNGGSTADLATRYAAARSAPLPNGLVIFSAGDNGQAKASGGYGYSMPVSGAFRNTFVSPVGGGSQLYIAVVDYSYKYMACGYGGLDQAQSSVSLPGECRGQTGVACVPHNGYSMCPDAVQTLYAAPPTHAVASKIVNSLLHNFSPGGEKDNYAAPECSAHMGYPAGFFDLQQSQYYNDLCPFVYEEFTKSYQP